MSNPEVENVYGTTYEDFNIRSKGARWYIQVAILKRFTVTFLIIALDGHAYFQIVFFTVF